MSFDEEDKKSKGEKNWAKERERPAEAEAAEGRWGIWALFCSRRGGRSVGVGPVHGQVVAGSVGTSVNCWLRWSAFTSLPQAEATAHFLPQVSSPREGIAMRVHQRNYQCLTQKLLIVVKTFETMKQSRQAKKKKITGSGRESSV